MAAIGKVSAVFTASTSGLTSGVNRASSSFRQLEQSARSTAAGMRTLVALNVASFLGNVASAVGGYVNRLVQMGAAQAQVIDRTSKLSERLGLSYAELSGLSLAGDLAGVSMDQIAAAMTKADVALVKATNGSKQANAAFASLGLNVAELAGMNPAQRFQAIAAAIAALPTEAQRAAAAVALFGRQGAELLPLFNSGAGAMAEAAAQAERLGLALTDAQGQDVEAMNDAFTMAYKAIEGVIQQVVAYLSPALKAAADTFTNLVGSIGGANIGQAIGDALLRGARFLAQIGDFLIKNFGSVFDYFSRVGQQWTAGFDFGNRVANFFLFVFKTFEAIGNLVGKAITTAASYLFSGAAELAAQYDAAASDNIRAAQNAFNAAFTENAPATGQAIAGPLTTALDAAIAQAEQSANQVAEVAAKPPPAVTVEVAGITEAIKATDSRSREGVAEMFRLMRGTGADVQERQLAALEQIADNTAGSDELLGTLEY